MDRIILQLMVLICISPVLSDSVVQTSWSGGSGTYGPVTSWSDEYYSEMGINTFHTENALILSRDALTTPIEHYVDPEASSWSLWSSDINGDGYIDLVTTKEFSDEYIWCENTDGSGITWINHIVDNAEGIPKSTFPSDIDGDGDMDIIGADEEADKINWWQNVDGSGLVWLKHIVDEDFSDPWSIYSEDIDGDGDMDIISGGWMSISYISWWENLDGTGTSWSEHVVGGEYVMSVYSEDIDGDGDMDILDASWTGTSCLMVWWENADGTGTTWNEHSLSVFSYYSFAEDIDGDGDMDVLYCDSPGYEIGWLENVNGSGTSWVKHVILDPYMTFEICADDLDGDGDMDVLCGEGYMNDISWFENIDGAGMDWFRHQISDESNSNHAFCAADVDGNGYNNFISIGGSPLSWWNITEYSSYGELISSSLYLGNDPGWGSIDWTCEEPAGTSISFQVRACDSPDSTGMGAWSDILHAPCDLYSILDENDSYVQYKAILQTTDSSVTPVLEDVTISWDPLGIEGAEPAPLNLLPFIPNPSYGSPVIRFSLPEQTIVDLKVFDISGRLVGEIPGEEYSAGYNDVQLEDLSSGIYFCRMVSGDFTATQRFVVVK